MAAASQSGPEASLAVRRTFAAPRERVFRAWTDPTVMRHWFCPTHFAGAQAEVDLRVGGAYRITMQPEGGGPPHIVYGTYREITPPERLVFTWRWDQEQADDSLVTIDFRDLGAETEVVLHHERFPTTALRDSHNEGWAACLEHLAQALPGLP